MRGLILSCLVFVVAVVYADDGSWNDQYSLSGGSLYSEEQHPTIALEKEYLILEDFLTGYVDVWFYFYNAGEQVHVQAGFPIEITVSLDTMIFSKGNLYFPGEAKGETVYVAPTGKYGGNSYPSEYFTAAGVEIRQSEATDYMTAESFQKERVEIKAENFNDPDLLLSIEQNGATVPVTSVVIEKDPKSGVPLRFHYRHELIFPAHAYSVVHVRYKPVFQTEYSQRMGGFYTTDTWHYVLSTGATWKGVIGEMVLAVPEGSNLGETQWQKNGFWNGYDLYAQKKFEPATTENITCSVTTRTNADTRIRFDDPIVQTWSDVKDMSPLVKDITATSWLKEKGESYTNDGIVTGAPFGPEALFDGIRETAWCEGVKGDGIGETVSFILHDGVAGFRIQNGYVKSLLKEEGKNYHEFYYLNNRPQQLILSSLDKKFSYTIHLADKPLEWQYFSVALPPGSYVLKIQSVYKGTKWADTCLGEIEFNPLPYSVLTGYLKDPFFSRFITPVK